MVTTGIIVGKPGCLNVTFPTYMLYDQGRITCVVRLLQRPTELNYMKVSFNHRLIPRKCSSYMVTTNIFVRHLIRMVLSTAHILFSICNNRERGYSHFVVKKTEGWSSWVSYISQKPSPAWLQSFYQFLISHYSQILTQGLSTFGFYFVKPNVLELSLEQTKIKLKSWEDSLGSSW